MKTHRTKSPSVGNQSSPDVHAVGKLQNRPELAAAISVHAGNEQVLLRSAYILPHRKISTARRLRPAPDPAEIAERLVAGHWEGEPHQGQVRPFRRRQFVYLRIDPFIGNLRGVSAKSAKQTFRIVVRQQHLTIDFLQKPFGHHLIR